MLEDEADVLVAQVGQLCSAPRTSIPASVDVHVGRSSRPRMGRSVDLPQPEGPVNATISPGAISSSIPSKATIWPGAPGLYTLETPWREAATVVAAPSDLPPLPRWQHLHFLTEARTRIKPATKPPDPRPDAGPPAGITRLRRQRPLGQLGR